MRRYVIGAAALAVLAAGTLVIGRTAPVDEERAAKHADHALIAAFGKGDQAAVGALLDRHFTFTDRQGKTLSRREALKDFSPLSAAASGTDSDVEIHFYGRMLTVRGAHEDARFLRVFVKRRHAWKAFLLLETPIAAAGRPASVEQAAGAGDCHNPCRSVPYTPKTEMDKAILATWQKTKLLEWKPDAAQWASFIADEFMIINNTTVRNREQRVAIAKRAQDAGIGTPGDPIVSMQIYDFGSNSAVMISQHAPYRGGRPYTNVRIWVWRDNRWQLALTQQVALQSAAPIPAVASKE